MTAQQRLPKTLVESIRDALTTNALPGETEGFDREQQRNAAEFIASAAAVARTWSGSSSRSSTTSVPPSPTGRRCSLG